MPPTMSAANKLAVKIKYHESETMELQRYIRPFRKKIFINKLYSIFILKYFIIP